MKQDIYIVSKCFLIRYLLNTKEKIGTIQRKQRHHLNQMMKISITSGE